MSVTALRISLIVSVLRIAARFVTCLTITALGVALLSIACLSVSVPGITVLIVTVLTIPILGIACLSVTVRCITALHIWILRCLPLHLSGVDLSGVVLIGGLSGSGCVKEHGFLAVRISAVSMRFFHIGLLSGFASYRMRTASAVIAVKIK